MAAEWRSRFLLIRIAVAFGLLMAAYYAFAATALYETRIYQPYVRISADLSARILDLLGYQVVARGDFVESAEFGLRIGRGCDGLEPTALFAAAVLAFSAPALLKLPALAIGIALLGALNLVRIVSLFLVGIYFPDSFHTLHVDVWQVLFILAGVVLFSLWLAYAVRRPMPASHQGGGDARRSGIP
jgi:exosortase H (IPTLxxWG-CTERM-specific)